MVSLPLGGGGSRRSKSVAARQTEVETCALKIRQTDRETDWEGGGQPGGHTRRPVQHPGKVVQSWHGFLQQNGIVSGKQLVCSQNAALLFTASSRTPKVFFSLCAAGE